MLCFFVGQPLGRSLNLQLCLISSNSAQLFKIMLNQLSFPLNSHQVSLNYRQIEKPLPFWAEALTLFLLNFKRFPQIFMVYSGDFKGKHPKDELDKQSETKSGDHGSRPQWTAEQPSDNSDRAFQR